MEFRHVAVFLAVALAASGMAAAHEAHEESEHVDTVILASTANYPDALVAAAAGAKIGVPVLLTDQDSVPQQTQTALNRLAPSDVIVAGGPAVVSEGVVSSLDQDYNVTRLWGTTRYGTAVEVAGHFWVEGADEAVLVQNSLQEKNGTVIAAAKDLAQEGEAPIYLTPEGSVPAVVLTSLQDLGVEEVTVVGTQVSDSYRSSLTEIGVSIDEEITGETDDDVKDNLQNRTRQDINGSEELLVVASSGFRLQIAAANFPNTNTFHVTADEDIAEVVSLVNAENISSVKVAGRPGLAEDAAEALRQQTDADVRLVVATAAEAVRMNTNLTRANIPSFAAANRKRMQQWVQQREQSQAFVKKRANKTLQRAQRLVDANASEEAHDALMKAETLFARGKYVEALEEANEALSEVRVHRFEENRDNFAAIQDNINEEVQDLQERVNELRELNREFAEAMEANLTVEERLEVIDEFRNERRETVEELMEEAQKTGGDIMKALQKAERRFEEREDGAGRLKVDIECTDEQSTELSIEGHDGRVEVDGTVGLSNLNYKPAQSVTVDEQNGTVSIDIGFTQRDGFGGQCVANAEVERRVPVAAGNWTVALTVTVDGEEKVGMTETVQVTADDGEDDTEDDMDNESAEAGADGMSRPLAPSTFTLESTDGTSGTPQTFYYNGTAVDEIAVESGETTITFAPRADGTYSAGAQFYSVPDSVFGESEAIDGGETTSVTFNATEDFTIEQWWPGEDVKKAEIDVDVE